MDTETVTIKVTPEQKEMITAEWKAAKGVTSCSQFVKAAINSYCGKLIFDEKKARASYRGKCDNVIE